MKYVLAFFGSVWFAIFFLLTIFNLRWDTGTPEHCYKKAWKRWDYVMPFRPVACWLSEQV